MVNIPFLQTKEWAEFQRSLGRPFFEYEQDHIAAVVFKYPLPFGKGYLYIPRGPSIDLTQMLGGFKDPVRKFIGWLTELARREGAIFIKVEPTIDYMAQILVENGFEKSAKAIQPAKTVIIDLEKSEDELLAAMRPKTRYNIKVAEKHGVEVEESKDCEVLWQLMKKTIARDGFSSHPREYYQKLLERLSEGGLRAKLFVARGGGQPAAAALVLYCGDTGYYLHGASDYSQRALMAPYRLHWEIIKMSRASGFKFYDLWGIDARKWPGLTRFKLGWTGEGSTVAGTRAAGRHESGISSGGRVVEYPGSFDLPISRIWHWAYKISRKILR